MTAASGGEGMPSHIVVIDDVPGPQGHGVHCIPHGPVGAADSRLAAFVLACEHDDEYGKDWL